MVYFCTLFPETFDSSSEITYVRILNVNRRHTVTTDPPVSPRKRSLNLSVGYSVRDSVEGSGVRRRRGSSLMWQSISLFPRVRTFFPSPLRFHPLLLLCINLFERNSSSQVLGDVPGLSPTPVVILVWRILYRCFWFVSQYPSFLRIYLYVVEGLDGNIKPKTFLLWCVELTNNSFVIKYGCVSVLR